MAEGHVVSGEDSLPDLPRRKLTEQPLIAKSRQHTLSAPGVGLFDGGKSPGSSRCSSPRLRRSLDLIRISRNEWEQRERTISSLRADKNELNSVHRQHSDLERRHQHLQKACLQLTRLLDCTEVTEISGDTITNVVYPKLAQLSLHSDTERKQISQTNEELIKARSDLSSMATRLSASEAQTQQLKSAIIAKDTEIQQLKNTLEQLSQSETQCKAMLQSMEGEVKTIKSKRKSEDKNQCLQQNELTIMKKESGEKKNEIASLKDQLNTLQMEKNELQERSMVSDAAYEELCIQISDALQMDPSESYDFEKMLVKINDLMEQCNDQKLKIDSLNHLNQVTELDSKANRETILRLVADVKKHEEQSQNASNLQKKLDELKEKFETTERDKISLSQRLAATQSSLASLQLEMNGKEKSIKDMKHLVNTLRQENKRDQIELLLEPYTELCSQLRNVLKCSSDEMIPSYIDQLIKEKQAFELKYRESERSNVDTLHKLKQTNEQLKDTEEELVTEKSKLDDLNRELELCEILRSKIQEMQRKHETFLKRLLQALEVETGSMLVGDFAEDAVFVRIQQLSKLESQAVLEKQTAFYSIQRKLKSCRQLLEAKDLQLGLSQRKVSSLESRLSELSQKEIEWNATIDKGKQVDRQLERLQDKVMKQQETIGTLKIDSESLNRLKSEWKQQEDKIERYESQIEALQQNKIHLSQQLAEARVKAQSIASQDKERADLAEKQLEDTRNELKTVIKDKQELLKFKSSVTNLVATSQHEGDEDDSKNTLNRIEEIILSCNRYREMSTSLQASLRQLETGFKRGYQDTLTLLNTK